MPTPLKCPNFLAPLQAAAFPPVRQREAVSLGALFLTQPDADELAMFSPAQCRDLATMAMRWFPSWEPYRPAHDLYRRAFDCAAGRYELTGPWSVYDLTRHSQTNDHTLHTVACAASASLRIEDAWFTPPFILLGESNEAYSDFFCGTKIIDAFVRLAQLDHARWLLPAIEQKA